MNLDPATLNSNSLCDEKNETLLDVRIKRINNGVDQIYLGRTNACFCLAFHVKKVEIGRGNVFLHFINRGFGLESSFLILVFIWHKVRSSHKTLL